MIILDQYINEVNMVVQISLSQGKYALVDDEYADLVKQCCWHFAKGHARGRPFFEDQLMHRFLYETIHGFIPEGMQIDHIDGDGLNNQLSNLRLITNRMNAHNRKIQREGKTVSGYIGVTWHPKKNLWQARIRIGNRRPSLGWYHNAFDAHLAYQAALERLKDE